LKLVPELLDDESAGDAVAAAGEPAEVHAGGDAVAIAVGAVPGRVVAAGRLAAIDQGRNRAAADIVDRSVDLSGTRDAVGDCRAVVERIGLRGQGLGVRGQGASLDDAARADEPVKALLEEGDAGLIGRMAGRAVQGLETESEIDDPGLGCRVIWGRYPCFTLDRVRN